MKTFNFTPKELQAAVILVKVCLDGMGGKRPSSLEHDEFTWVDGKDLMQYGYTRHEAAGFFSSLSEKGFIAGYFAGMKSNQQCETYVTTEGWRFIDTVWDENQHLLLKEVA